MSIHYAFQKIKTSLTGRSKDAFIHIVIIIFIGTASFGLGRLSALEKNEPVRIEYPNDYDAALSASASKQMVNSGEGLETARSKKTDESRDIIVASRNGKAYYYIWCNGMNRIKEHNRVWFDSEHEAEQKGYKLASGCRK